MSEIAELHQKLLEHKNQLREVVLALEATPDDPELLQIKGDLEQVVALTEELAGGVDVGLVPSESKWKTGDRCTAKWEKDNKYYAAIITDIAEDDFHITFLDYGNVAVVPETSIKPYSHLSKEELTQGTRIRAIWGEDGLFYDATVANELDETGKIGVRFPKFGKKKFLVSPQDCRAPIGKPAHNPNAPLPDELVIPEGLRLKPTDTEAQRRNKRARVKVLKQQFKKQKVEAEGTRKTNNWLSFVKSAKTTAIMRKKPSMFATTEEGTVGVIGSGRGMTENPSLIKHRFKEVDEEDQDDEGGEQGGAQGDDEA
jgi:survival-of-motor-neuron-related-splicing factor 30